MGLNAELIGEAVLAGVTQIGAIDCSFIGVVALALHLISKLRSDADLRYCYTGEQKLRGARRKYDGKVDFSDLRRLTLVEQLKAGLNLYTAVVWHLSLKRQIRIAYLVDTRQPGKPDY